MKNYIAYENNFCEIDDRILKLCGEGQPSDIREYKAIYKIAAQKLYHEKECKNQKNNYSEKEKEIIKICKNMNKDINDVIRYLKKINNWKGDIFANDTGLSRSLLSKHVNDIQNDIEKDKILAICIASNLSIDVIDIVLEKNGMSLSKYIKRELFCRKILSNLEGIALLDFNEILIGKNYEPLSNEVL